MDRVLMCHFQKQRDSSDGLPKLILFEHDERFGVFPEFVYYDFRQPLKLPSTVKPIPLICELLTERIWCSAELKGSVDRLIIDPPFFAEDCQTKCSFSPRHRGHW